MPVLITCDRFLDVHALPNVASANIYFVADVRSIGGINIITKTPGFVGGGKIGMFQQLNKNFHKLCC